MNLIDYPNPQFRRVNYHSLNGIWSFFMKKGQETLKRDIRVPFCPESVLSGIGETDFIKECKYERFFTVDKIDKNTRVVLHFGAVDYRTLVYINGKYVGSHVGGYTPFDFDITDLLVIGENKLELTVYDSENGCHLTGKQSPREKSFGCFYTRTTGIWQTVWLEYVPSKYVKEFFFYPNVDGGEVTVDLHTNECGNYKIEFFYEGELCGEADGYIEYRAQSKIRLTKKYLWELGKGRLYDVKLTFEKDEVYSYFGLRETKFEGVHFLLNGKKTFQKLVLDQGYYPDGIYTAPNVEAMQKDIDLGLRLGFNGARLHQKLFDPRFLYLCDKAGYMVWGEFPSWGQDYSTLSGVGQFLAEWQEAISRDFNHPSIVLWCPLNEVWVDWANAKKQPNERFIEIVYDITKQLDATRPCVDASGGRHTSKTDLYDFHCYESVDKLKEYLQNLEESDELKELSELNFNTRQTRYRAGQPVNVSEFGGISFCINGVSGQEVEICNESAVQSEDAWGYGKGENNGDAFVARFEKLVNTIFACDKISGYCYTQLYDIEQEQNGFYCYDRSDKLTEAQKDRIKMIQSKK